ncbi:MAG: lysylphosphatidylglycerol synthase transmembrane domain-containing protein [Bryobacteraceae bacterium]
MEVIDPHKARPRNVRAPYGRESSRLGPIRGSTRFRGGKTKLWVTALVALLLLAGWIAWRVWGEEEFDWTRFAATFRDLRPGWFAAALLLAFSTYVGRAFRWRVLIRPQKRHPSLWGLFTATAVGFTALVLFGRPGEMARPYLVALKERLSFSSQMAAWLLERIYDLVMALLIFGYALSSVRASGVQVGERMHWVLEAGGYFVGVIGLICVAVFLALRQYGDRSERRILDGLAVLPERYRSWLGAAVMAFRHGVESTKSWSAVGEVLAYSVLEWVLIVACNICLFHAIPATAGMRTTDVLIYLGFVAFGSVVQIPGVGGGMQIVAVVVLTELFGLPLDSSTGVALISWIVTFVVIVPIGLMLAFHEGLQWKKLGHLESIAEVEAGTGL